MSYEKKLKALRALKKHYLSCTRCELCESRTHVVFDDGAPDAQIMLIGEAPGEKEDISGIPFVGPSGKVIGEILERAGAKRDELHITNAVLCRPAGNRTPTKVELAACLPRLIEQIRIVDPDLIIASGKVAAQVLLGRKVAITKERGTIVDAELEGPEGTFVVPILLTVHPSHILQQPSTAAGGLLRETFKDFQMAFEVADRLAELWYDKKTKERT